MKTSGKILGIFSTDYESTAAYAVIYCFCRSLCANPGEFSSYLRFQREERRRGSELRIFFCACPGRSPISGNICDATLARRLQRYEAVEKAGFKRSCARSYDVPAGDSRNPRKRWMRAPAQAGALPRWR